MHVRDALADAHAPHSAPECGDDPRRLAPEAAGRVPGTGGAVVHVNVVDADRGMAHLHFVAAGLPGSNCSQRRTSGPPCAWKRIIVGMGGEA